MTTKFKKAYPENKWYEADGEYSGKPYKRMTPERTATMKTTAIDAAQAELQALKEQLIEEKERNDLFSDCLHRGLRLWRQAHPAEEKWIDGAENIKWLVETVTEQKKQLAAKDAAIVKMREQVAYNAGIRNEYQDFEEFFELAEKVLKGTQE